MQLSAKTIIKILPLEDSFKTELLGSLDLLDLDRKFAMERILWKTYDAFYGLKLEENMQLGLLRVGNHEEKLDKDFYRRIREQTKKDMETEMIDSTEKVDLSEARRAMELIIREMRASKIKKVN